MTIPKTIDNRTRSVLDHQSCDLQIEREVVQLISTHVKTIETNPNTGQRWAVVDDPALKDADQVHQKGRTRLFCLDHGVYLDTDWSWF